MEINPLHSQQATFQPHVFEAGSKKGAEESSSSSSLSSSAPKTGEKTSSSCGGSFLYYVSLPFVKLWGATKAIINAITCGMCCQDKPDLNALYNAVKDVSDASSKKAFLEAFPDQEKAIVLDYVATERNAALGKDKGNSAKVNEWNSKHKARLEKAAEKAIESNDPNIFKEYAGRLKLEIDAASKK